MQRTYPKRQRYSHPRPPYTAQQVGPNRAKKVNTLLNQSVNSGRFCTPENSSGHQLKNGVTGFYHHSPQYRQSMTGKVHQANQLNTKPCYKATHGQIETSKVPQMSQETNSGDKCLPKLVHVSEKRPARYIKEPHWLRSFEHYEVRSHSDGDVKQIENLGSYD